ncbi:MAG: hypothetical protein KAS32_19020 [Candidatus Peribacteraceae bacterium]|nr:hypothetical protein [Candidatus Peribacteraceae bacterium]
MKEKNIICRTSKLKDWDKFNFYLAAWIGSLILIISIIYLIIKAILDNESIEVIPVLIGVILIFAVYFIFPLVFNEKPIISEGGLSLPTHTIREEPGTDVKMRQNVPWTEIKKMRIYSTNSNQWECVFIHNTDTEIKLTSQMGYTKECLRNLIKLSEELKQKEIEIEVSNTAIQLANE